MKDLLDWRSPGDHSLNQLFACKLIQPYIPDRPANMGPPFEWTFPEVDHEDIMYRLVTASLGLPYGRCKEAKLELMLSLEYSPCIDLFTPSIARVREKAPAPTLEERVRTSRIHGHQYVTMCTARNTADYGCSLLEAAFVQRGLHPSWRSLGFGSS